MSVAGRMLCEVLTLEGFDLKKVAMYDDEERDRVWITYIGDVTMDITITGDNIRNHLLNCVAAIKWEIGRRKEELGIT